jgi:K+-transporting ATPase KdpF subunit
LSPCSSPWGSSPPARPTSVFATACANSLSAMETIIIGLIALGCLVYLVVAVLRPEKF